MAEIGELLAAEAAYDEKGKLVGIRLRTPTAKPEENTLLLFNDAEMPGFRMGDQFIPSLGKAVIYKKLDIRVGE